MWKDIKGYEGLYEINTNGFIRSKNRIVMRGKTEIKLKGKDLKRSLSKNGYYSVVLCREGIRKSKYIHRLLSEEFIENIDKKEEVNHKNGIKSDNRIENLEWVTPKENTIHAVKNGLAKSGGNRYNARRVKQFDKNGNLIRIFSYINEVKKYGYDVSSVFKCCIGKRKTAHKFIFNYF